MQQIDNVIKQYLEMETNFAIMISGNWGAGKTYYYNKNISELIKKTDVYNNSQKKYKPIKISLFGIKTIEEVQTQIFLSLYPLLKNKNIKLGSSIAKVIAKGILMIKGLGEYSKILDNVNVKGDNFINFNELVICFDDLERHSKNFDFGELIGFVNNLVENENTKVILIANEDKISETEYKDLKEKIVGNTIEFKPEKKETLNNIIESKFAGFKTYKDFINENQELIFKNFFSNSKNLRTLSYALSYYHNVFSQIEIEISKHKILENLKSDILKKTLKFTLIISIEHKKGIIDYKNRKNLDTNLLTELDQIRLENLIGSKINTQKEEVKDYKDSFLEKYYSDEKFDFINSIYNYLTGASIFDIKLLFEELKDIYHISEDSVPIQYEIFKSLSYPNIYELNDETYMQKTIELQKFAFDGLFKINEYLTIFYFLTRFNNPLKYNLDELLENLKKGIDKSIELSSKIFIHDLDFYLNIPEENEFKDYLSKLRTYILDKNNEVDNQINYSELEELEKLFYKSSEDFFIKIYNSESKYVYSAVFTNFNPEKFYQHFIKSANNEKWNIFRYFRMRYKSSYTIFDKEKEVSFFEKLNVLLNEKNDETCGPTTYLINEFKKIVSEVYNKIK